MLDRLAILANDEIILLLKIKNSLRNSLTN